MKVLAVEGNRIRLSRKAILKEQRAKMGGGELPPEGGSEPTNGDAPAPALTIEGGGDFADDEPNFNRDAPQSVGSGSSTPSGDRDRGGDRGRGGRPGGGGGRGRGRGPGRGGHGGGGRGGHGGGHSGPRHKF